MAVCVCRTEAKVRPKWELDSAASQLPQNRDLTFQERVGGQAVLCQPITQLPTHCCAPWLKLAATSSLRRIRDGIRRSEGSARILLSAETA
eukprot:CAMPEP_0181488550 /NCGR_PEP_ID=MMETSP1110-20121109/48460_1 /TAXON_ID=174948 /ORGANISM="Symbiodinium sp., Strain CCMP421" /LENGTH=90 /DNA_ID=CAMNT_0023615227 /DNA_START=222 /DNA_END=490 /DNA_ORIENTATION=+